MKKSATIAVLIGVCLGGAANAQGPDFADLIRGRQAGMMLSGATMGAIKVGIDNNQPLQVQRFNTRALSRWAHAVPGMFPQGSGPESGVQTNAKAEIWTDRAGFEARAAAYAADVDRLVELAQGEDAAAFSAQWTQVRTNCQACHDVYKVN